MARKASAIHLKRVDQDQLIPPTAVRGPDVWPQEPARRSRHVGAQELPAHLVEMFKQTAPHSLTPENKQYFNKNNFQQPFAGSLRCNLDKPLTMAPGCEYKRTTGRSGAVAPPAEFICIIYATRSVIVWLVWDCVELVLEALL
jgi:hypothetical protein